MNALMQEGFDVRMQANIEGRIAHIGEENPYVDDRAFVWAEGWMKACYEIHDRIVGEGVTNG